MAFIVTRIQVGDYDVFKPMFDEDAPGQAISQRASDPARRRG